MSNVNSIVGPLQAEALENDKEYLMNYVSMNGAKEILKDTLISNIISGEKVILTGVRGTGKTMVLKTGEALQTDTFAKKIDKRESDLILPCYITFSGFKNDVSLEDELDIKRGEMKIVKEVFRGYFYITLLNAILNQLDKYEVDKSVEFKFFGVKTKFGIRRQIKKALHNFKQIGFKELTILKKTGAKIGTDIPQIDTAFKIEGGKEESIKSISLDDMQKTILFKTTLESICKTYGIKRIHFLFDEVFYLKYLQSEFFDILFGFRNYQYCSFTLTAYPTLMDYGNEFDIPDDAKVLEVNQKLYKPNKNDYEKPLYDFVERRINHFGKVRSDTIISQDGLEQLILYTQGNPRILLQTIDYLWQQNRMVIKKTSITNDIVNYITNTFYITYLERQSKRYNVNLERTSNFLDVIVERLKDNNERSENGTIFFLLDKSIIQYFAQSLDLLQYCRIIDQYKMGDFGGSSSKKGTIFSINPLYARFYGVFSRNQINRLPQMVENAIHKDRKIQFSSLDNFLGKNKVKLVNSCPRYSDGQCVEKLCNDTYSESWPICPFNQLKLLVEEENEPQEIIKIELTCLSISHALVKRINNIGIYTVFEAVDAKINGLKKAHYIGDERARTIYYESLEYIDENL